VGQEHGHHGRRGHTLSGSVDIVGVLVQGPDTFLALDVVVRVASGPALVQR